MKIRSSFVSNSSSASFILKVDLPLDKIITSLSEEFGYYDMQKKFESHIECRKKYGNESDVDAIKALEMIKNGEYDDKFVIEQFLKVNCWITEKDGSTEFESYTIMYNCLSNFNRVVRDLVTFCYVYKIPHTVEIKDDP